MTINELINATYLQPADYKLVKGIDLDEELRGTSDEESGDAQRMIFRVEQKVIQYLSTSYDFKEELLENDKALTRFKIGICDQIEEELVSGKDASLCAGAIFQFRKAGLMNVRRY